MLTIFIISNITKELKRLLKINCQQINSEAYVGCISGRIRDELWKRINDDNLIREATMIYAIQNHVVIENKCFDKVERFDLIDLIKA